MKTSYKVMFGAVTCLLTILISSFTFDAKKEEPTSFVQTTIPMFEMAKTHTLEVLDAMPEEKFSYKPTEVSKTFASQMVHIGYSMKYFRMGMIEGNRIKYEEPDPGNMTKAEIRELVATSFDDYISAIEKLSEEDLKVELPFGPEKKISRAQAIIFAHDHVTNHRAKANLYVRMNDMDPPGYKFI